MRRKLAAMLLGLMGLGAMGNVAQSVGVTCSATVSILAEFCGGTTDTNPNGSTLFRYEMASSVGEFGVRLVVPLLDPNAIIPGSVTVNGSAAAYQIVTDPTQMDVLWGNPTLPVGKEAFADPAALLSVAVLFATQTSNFAILEFSSFNGWVDGPIKFNGTLIDPPVPGAAIPEPATLALLGMALTGFGLARRRRR